MTTERKWIRFAGAGEGKWYEVRGERMETDFERCKRKGFLPVAWSVPGHQRVFETARPDVWPNWVIQDGVLIHQFHEIATPLPANATAQQMQYAQRQILNLVKTTLEVEGETHASET